MKLGILAYRTSTGLGVQTLNYHKFLRPSKTLVADLSAYNRMPLNNEWFPDAWRVTNGFPSNADYDQFLDGLDCLLLAETPLNYYLLEAANRRGIASILVYNYEFLDYMKNPWLPRPTVFAGPTLWNKDRLAAQNIEITHLPVPIDGDELPRREITQARHFFHVAGRPAVNDRNGTFDFIAAVKVLSRPSDVRFTIYCQSPTPQLCQALRGTPIQLVEHVPNYADMYRDGDVMVLPRRYGGLCLPLNEAIGSGIPVLMPDIDPNNTWLPAEWLVPATHRGTFMAHCPVDLYNVRVDALTQRMSDLYRNAQLVSRMHRQAQELAEDLRWSALEPRYKEVINVAIKKMKGKCNGEEK